MKTRVALVEAMLAVGEASGDLLLTLPPEHPVCKYFVGDPMYNAELQKRTTGTAGVRIFEFLSEIRRRLTAEKKNGNGVQYFLRKSELMIGAQAPG